MKRITTVVVTLFFFIGVASTVAFASMSWVGSDVVVSQKSKIEMIYGVIIGKENEIKDGITIISQKEAKIRELEDANALLESNGSKKDLQLEQALQDAKDVDALLDKILADSEVK